MNRAPLILFILATSVLAQEPPCKPAPPGESVEVSLKKGSKLKDLAAWYRKVTCREIDAPLSAADLPLTLFLEGSIPAFRANDVVRAGASSVGFEVRDDNRGKLTLVRAAQPCDPAKARAALERTAAAASCTLELEVFGTAECIDTNVKLEPIEGSQYKVKQLAPGSLLHAVGLREGDVFSSEAPAITKRINSSPFELAVTRGAAQKTLRCVIIGESAKAHPASVLREALVPRIGGGSDSACTVDPAAITTQGDVTQLDTKKAPGLELECLMKSSRIVPAFQDGKSQGLKLFSIRPGSLLSLLGIQNGDTVKTINGHELDSPDKILELYSSLRKEKKFTVVLERRGQPVTLNIVLK